MLIIHYTYMMIHWYRWSNDYNKRNLRHTYLYDLYKKHVKAEIDTINTVGSIYCTFFLKLIGLSYKIYRY